MGRMGAAIMAATPFEPGGTDATQVAQAQRARKIAEAMAFLRVAMAIGPRPAAEVEGRGAGRWTYSYHISDCTRQVVYPFQTPRQSVGMDTPQGSQEAAGNGVIRSGKIPQDTD